MNIHTLVSPTKRIINSLFKMTFCFLSSLLIVGACDVPPESTPTMSALATTCPACNTDIPVYRYHHPSVPIHDYSLVRNDAAEAQRGLVYDFVGFRLRASESPGSEPLFLHRDARTGFVRISTRDALGGDWKLEQRLGWAFAQPAAGLTPLYAYHMPGGEWFYSPYATDDAQARQGGWNYVGVLAYVDLCAAN